MKLKAKIIGSKVHDVGYRVFILDRAQELCLSGFEALNRKEDGSQAVFVFMEGDEQQIAELKRFIEQEIPPGAEVSNIVFEDCQGKVQNIDRFYQMTNTRQLNKGINALLSIDKKQDKMLEKQDKMIEKLDEARVDIVHEIRGSRDAIINELVSEIRGSSDAIVEKLDETGVAITREIRGQKSSIDQRFDRIEEDISRIKSKIGLS
jgi:acylphosphatase